MANRVDPRVRRSRARALEVGRRLLVREGLGAITHLRVAEAGGGGRRSLYRHWPDSRALLHDVLAEGEVRSAERTGELRDDLIAHLDALRLALTEGHLGLVVCALGERAFVDPTFEPLRESLTEAGCAPLRDILSSAVSSGELPGGLDMAAAMAALEGPVFYRAMVRRERLATQSVPPVVDALLRCPPLSSDGPEGGP